VKSIKVLEPGRLVLEERQMPAAGPGDVLVKVMACGICGTDVHIWRGEYLGSYPVVPGHEFSGIVEAVGSGVTRSRPGDRVAVEPNVACDNCPSCLNNRQNFCLNWQGIGVTRPGGFAQYALAPERAVFAIGSLGFEEGAFMEPLSCVLHGLERARISAGANIAVLGAGPIGILLLESALALGAAAATVAERNPARLAFARTCGARTVVSSLDELEKDGYDLVIDATGSPPVMARTIDFARPGGTVLLFGVPPTGAKMEIEPFVIFRKGLTVLSSYTSVRNSFQALRLMQQGRVPVTRVVSHRLPLEEFTRGIELIETGADDVKKVLLLPNGPLS
jgi:D-arabinitol dehydrogenase (NADP+)